MYTKFRNSHLLQVLQTFEKQRLPLDVFLRIYFRNHKAIGSHDRKYITETLYAMIRWKELIDFFCLEDKSWEKRLEILENLIPENHLQDTSIPIHVRVSFPKPYFDFLSEQIGEERAISFCLASNSPAPTTIRTNILKISQEHLLQRLKLSQLVKAGAFCPLAIHFQRRVNFLVLPEFKEGLFEVQDEGSQLAALLVDVKPGDHFLDYCAGSGGKSLAIAPSMQGKGQLYLHDIRSQVLLEAKKRLHRAGIQNGQIVFPEDLKAKNLLQKMDWVLVDAPCSGSGTLRRNPDMKEKFSLEELQKTVQIQREIFTKALAFVKPKGHIVYTTCSIFPMENEQQVEYFTKNLPVTSVNKLFTSSPCQGGMDGFYSIVLQKS
jgi:16S rRNA C967 or C1407 C5-methylase (RsmB/RsmF family)